MKPGKGDTTHDGPGGADDTVTVALSEEQFTWLREAITNQRRVWATLERMHRITLRHMWDKLPGTAHRKRLPKKTLGTN